MFRWIVAGVIILLAAPASAQVQIDLGINISAPPPMVMVPEVQAVQYVPTASANLFFFNGQYWVFNDGVWYYAAGFNGPWVFASPEYVPQPLLIVPVTYYRRPPPAWRGWEGRHPPQWTATYGRSWSGHREVFVPAHGQAPVQAQPVRQQPIHQAPVHEAPPQQHAEARPPPHAEVKAPPPHSEARPAPPPAHAEPPHEAPPPHAGEEHH